ncbi:importin-7 isoform X2 [Acyrthosiphon pisum]|uniref:Importin N-terminal domain-containing protein n=1 Tax=Acyrthosiphon pisum TaxID=7029 RepID=A0A8R1W019_ACYPI|nr:importin-7 isoform X2 [Acyrthosiphon pisum]|eukprot:XP_001946207.1 PREDICTED: importin-7 isoform X2 [Acyrthosiphon pisum]
MDLDKLANLLNATLYQPHRSEAEEQLQRIHKIAGFGPALLQIVVSSDIEMSTRQASAIYLKNLMYQSWATREDEPNKFSVHEQDRIIIRDTILDVVVQVPELVRAQLTVCLVTMLKHDFPGRWTNVVEKIDAYLKSENSSYWVAGIIGFSALIKAFEYQKADKSPIHAAVKVLLPSVYNVMVLIVGNSTAESVALQKTVIKSYFKLVQFTISPDLMERNTFTKWMELLTIIACSPVPEEVSRCEHGEIDQLPWWKIKKWALHTMYRIFERYGSPGSVAQEYQQFSIFYVKTFSNAVIDIILRILDQYRNKVYIPPRVMQMCMHYLNQCVSIGHTWKIIKPHIAAIIQDVIFPLMSHSECDQELWETDPQEYISQKFDIFEDLVSPVMAGQTVLHSACKKRKDILPKAVQFIVGVITSNDATPSQKDGALYMLGALADVIFKKDMYKDQVGSMLYQHVFPVFQSPHGHLRARASWFIQHICEIKIDNDNIWKDLASLSTNALLTDKELPVKVQAGLAIQALLIAENKVEQLLEPRIKEITLELLKVLQQTENDDITSVVQKVIATYFDTLAPIMYDICQNLAKTFLQVLQSDDMNDKKEITGMSILSCIETILSVNDEQPQTLAALEPVVMEVIVHIFNTPESEYYEEALNLVCDLTNLQVSENMWNILQLIYSVFQNDGIDYFVDMMPCLHNYVTIGMEKLIKTENYMLIIFNMCKTVLSSESGEEAECHAAKLLEVIVLQCKGQIDQCIPPIVEVVLQRLVREIKSSELRAMCLQVIVAAIYYDPHLLFETLDKLQMSMSTNESISAHFIRQWLQDTDCFFGIHDRKLCVMGLLTLMALSPNRPIAVNEHANQIVPSMLMLFDGLNRAYTNRENQPDGETSDEEELDTENELATDEDEIDETLAFACDKRKPLFMTNTENADDDSDSDDEDEFEAPEETVLEVYTTPLDSDHNNVDETIDVYILFKTVLLSIQQNDPAWYLALTNHLNSDQQKSINELMVLAEQRRVEVENKKKEKLAGFKFDQATVPATFSFSNSNNSPFAFGR